MNEFKWEHCVGDTYRMKINGGYLYSIRHGLCFVPDSNQSQLAEYCKNVLEQRDVLITRLAHLEDHKLRQIDENRKISKRVDALCENIPSVDYDWLLNTLDELVGTRLDLTESRLKKLEDKINNRD